MSVLWPPINTFYLKYRDNYPTLRVRLKKPDGTPHDLTGAITVTLHVRLSGTATVVSRPMTIENILGGIITYQWLATDWTSSPALGLGDHEMEYEVTAAGSRVTFPNTHHDRLSVYEDLGQTT